MISGKSFEIFMAAKLEFLIICDNIQKMKNVVHLNLDKWEPGEDKGYLESGNWYL